VVLAPVAIGIIGGLVKIFWLEESWKSEPLTWYMSGLTGTTILVNIPGREVE